MIIWNKKKQEHLINITRIMNRCGLINWCYSPSSIPTLKEHVCYFWRCKKKFNFDKDYDKLIDYGWCYYDGFNYFLRLGPFSLEATY